MVTHLHDSSSAATPWLSPVLSDSPVGVPNAGCRLECHGVSVVRRSGATASASRTRPVSSSKAKSHKKDWAKAIRRKSEEIRRKREAAAQADAAAP